MSKELVPAKAQRFRNNVPTEWRKSIDTRIYWMWHQRLGTIQQIREKTTDVLDLTAAELVLEAVYGDDLNPLILLLQRLEGGTQRDDRLQEQTLRL